MITAGIIYGTIALAVAAALCIEGFWVRCWLGGALVALPCPCDRCQLRQCYDVVAAAEQVAQAAWQLGVNG